MRERIFCVFLGCIYLFFISLIIDWEVHWKLKAPIRTFKWKNKSIMVIVSAEEFESEVWEEGMLSLLQYSLTYSTWKRDRDVQDSRQTDSQGKERRTLAIKKHYRKTQDLGRASDRTILGNERGPVRFSLICRTNVDKLIQIKAAMQKWSWGASWVLQSHLQTCLKNVSSSQGRCQGYLEA